MYLPKVSIIIPVYNGANYLSQSIDSALAQTYKNLEVIVINDGSNDNGETEKVVNKYYGKVKYYSKVNGGVSTALNLGILKMEGEWFSWLSHDDVYLPNKIADQIEYLNNQLLSKEKARDVTKILLYCDTEFINDKSEVILKLKPIAKEFEPNIDIFLKNLKRNRLGGCSFLVHKRALESVGGFNENIRTVSDYDLWYRFLLNDYRFFYVPKTLVQGRMHKKQVTYELSDLGYAEFDAFHTYILKQIDKKPEYDDYKIFYKISCYARQRGFQESEKLGFKMMKSRCPIYMFFILKPLGIIYSEIYRTLKRLIKKIYTVVYIR